MKTEPIHVVCGIVLMNVLIFYAFDRGAIGPVQAGAMMGASLTFGFGYIEGRRSK